MFTLNPLQNPDALWQHIVMILVAALLGYVIGYIVAKQKEQELHKKLDRVTNDLERCVSVKRPVEQATANTSFRKLETVRKDDLKIIEGIGPKIEELLNSEGIFTFTKLSDTQPDDLTKILERSGNKFQIHDPHTWPQQANLAANQMWNQLKGLQKELNKGRFE